MTMLQLQEDQELIKINRVNKKNKAMETIEDRVPIMLNENKYFCLSILSKISEISKHILLDVFRFHYLGRKNIIHGNKGVHKEVLSTSKFIVWMKDFAGRYGQNSPDAQVLVLNHWLTKKKMFHIYCNEMDPPLVRTLLLGLNTLVLNYSLIQKCPRFHFLSICVLICITFFLYNLVHINIRTEKVTI